MIPVPDVNLAAVMPLLIISVGALVVLLGEVLLAGRETFFGRPVTREWLGSMLAIVSALFLGAVVVLACQHFVGRRNSDFYYAVAFSSYPKDSLNNCCVYFYYGSSSWYYLNYFTWYIRRYGDRNWGLPEYNVTSYFGYRLNVSSYGGMNKFFYQSKESDVLSYYLIFFNTIFL